MPRPAKGARLYYRKRDDRWFIRDTGGVERSTGCTHGERQAAEGALQRYLAEKHVPDFGNGHPNQVGIADALRLYVDERAPHTKRPDVVASAIPHLNAYWSDRRVSGVTPGACRGYVEWRTAMPQARYKDPATAPRVGAQTARRELEVLSAALGYAHHEHKLIYPVPVPLPDKGQPRERWLNRDEAAHLLRAALGFRWVSSDIRTRARVWARVREADGGTSANLAKSRHLARFILVGLYTGTRHDAILRLKWLPTTEGGWVDLRHSIIYRRGLIEGESSKRRTPVPISKRLHRHLARWRAESVSHVVEFDGEQIRRMRRAWNTARVAAGLGPEVTPHILRHTFATWAVQGGMPLGKVAAALGTTEKIVQSTYGHHAPEHLRDVVEFVSGRRR